MMGKSQHVEPKLFYHGLSLESRIPEDHILRKVKKHIDFNFIRSHVEHLYGINGHKSLDPAVILKLMFISIYYNVKSERALMEQLPLRLDWLWFCGYDLDEQTPDHSVLSKARRRWGQDAFSEFFAIVLGQCIDAGLVDGTTVHIDSSMIDANASKDSLKPQLRLIGQKLYNDLDEQSSPDTPAAEDTVHDNSDKQEANDGDNQDTLESRVSTTDPDARLGRKYGRSTLGYKDHRVIDDKCGIVTATITTPANVNDENVFIDAVEQHEANTDTQIKAAAADKAYGTMENYKYLKEHNAKACILHQSYGSQGGKFSSDKFIYDKQQDCFICPAGQKLTRFYRKEERDCWRYRADRAVCEKCDFFSNCVTSKTQGRQVQRADDACYVKWADNCISHGRRKYLLSRRKYKAEGSFADAANNHGFKRARWRGLAGMVIQNLLIAAIQNLRKLMRSLGNRSAANAANLPTATDNYSIDASKLLLRNVFATVRERILTFLKSVADKIRFQPTFQNYILFKPRWATCPKVVGYFLLPLRGIKFRRFYECARGERQGIGIGFRVQ
jgi:transposase